MIRLLRRLWHRLAYRHVPFETDITLTEVAVLRWEQLMKPSYYFETMVRQVGWDRWRKVGVFPEQIRDDDGRLVALRVNIAEALSEPLDPDAGVFYLDEPTLSKEE